MLATTNSFMHADQDQPRNKIGKNTKEDSLYERNYKIQCLINQAKHYQKT
jgi:hypothetical protein